MSYLTCPNCGGALLGDGYHTPVVCENTTAPSDREVDMPPLYCKPDIQADHTVDQIITSVSGPKGEYQGTCNRTACSNQWAVYYNHATHKYYCQECALLINEVNSSDAQRLFGHSLCTSGKHTESK